MLERLRSRTEAAEVFTSESRTTEVSFAAGELESVTEDQSYSRSLRVISAGRLGFASTSDPTDDEELIGMALEAAKIGPDIYPAFPGADERPLIALPPTATADPAATAATREELIAIGQSALAQVRAAHPALNLECHLSRTCAQVQIHNSVGLAHHSEETYVAMVISATSASDDDIHKTSAGRSSRALAPMAEVAPRFNQSIAWGQRRVPPPAGRLPVVFLPEAVGILLAPLLSGASGMARAGGSTPLAGRVGQKVLDSRFDLRMDPSRALAFGTRVRDHEGVPTRPRAIFANGVFSGFYHDLISAARTGEVPTGNGICARRTPPAPAPLNLTVRPGSGALADLLADIEDGLLVESVIGGGMGNPLSGAISNPVGSAYRIVKGEIVGRTRDVAIAGNVYELLASGLHSIGGHAREVGGGLLTPPIRLHSMNLSS